MSTLNVRIGLTAHQLHAVTVLWGILPYGIEVAGVGQAEFLVFVLVEVDVLDVVILVIIEWR